MIEIYFKYFFFISDIIAHISLSQLLREILHFRCLESHTMIVNYVVMGYDLLLHTVFISTRFARKLTTVNAYSHRNSAVMVVFLAC